MNTIKLNLYEPDGDLRSPILQVYAKGHFQCCLCSATMFDWSTDQQPHTEHRMEDYYILRGQTQIGLYTVKYTTLIRVIILYVEVHGTFRSNPKKKKKPTVFMSLSIQANAMVGITQLQSHVYGPVMSPTIGPYCTSELIQSHAEVFLTQSI